MTLQKALEIIGFSDKQAETYLALLQLGESSAYRISEKSGLKKPTTYVILDELIVKKVVHRVRVGTKTRYSSVSPRVIFELAEKEFDEAKNVLPQMESLQKNEARKIQSMYFDGMRGIEQALLYREKEMRGKELVGFYATPDAPSEELIEMFHLFEERMNKWGVKVRGVVPENKNYNDFRLRDNAHERDIVALSPHKYNAKTSLEVGDTFVRIVEFQHLQATIIESEDVASMVRQIFNMVWSTVKSK